MILLNLKSGSFFFNRQAIVEIFIIKGFGFGFCGFWRGKFGFGQSHDPTNSSILGYSLTDAILNLLCCQFISKAALFLTLFTSFGFFWLFKIGILFKFFDDGSLVLGDRGTSLGGILAGQTGGELLATRTFNQIAILQTSNNHFFFVLSNKLMCFFEDFLNPL